MKFPFWTKQKDAKPVAVSMGDGLSNLATGLATSRSKREHRVWKLDSLNNTKQYESAYMDSWIVRRVIDTIAEDVTREWREIKCAEADFIRQHEDELGVRKAVLDAIRWSRLYGGAGILLITDQDLRKPLNVNLLKKGSLKNLVVLDRFYLGGADIQTLDVTNENFLLPEHYLVANSGSMYVHHSHVIRFVGEPLPMRLGMMFQGWGDSALRQVMEVIEDLVDSMGGLAESLMEFNVDVVKREGLFTDITADQEQAIQKRFELFGLMKSVIRTAVLDGSETLERKTLSYSGIADVMNLMMHSVSGASHIPFTRLYGTSPAGMDATGEGDDRNYNDYLRTLQNSRLDPAMRKLDEVLVRSALGNFPSDFNYDWKPLSTPTPLDIANANKIQAEADAIYLDQQIITASQVMRNLQASEKYSFDEERIEEVEEIEANADLELIFNESNANETTSNGSDENDSGIERADRGEERVPSSAPSDSQGNQ